MVQYGSSKPVEKEQKENTKTGKKPAKGDKGKEDNSNG